MAPHWLQTSPNLIVSGFLHEPGSSWSEQLPGPWTSSAVSSLSASAYLLPLPGRQRSPPGSPGGPSVLVSTPTPNALLTLFQRRPSLKCSPCQPFLTSHRTPLLALLSQFPITLHILYSRQGLPCISSTPPFPSASSPRCLQGLFPTSFSSLLKGFFDHPNQRYYFWSL